MITQKWVLNLGHVYQCLFIELQLDFKLVHVEIWTVTFNWQLAHHAFLIV